MKQFSKALELSSSFKQHLTQNINTNSDLTAAFPDPTTENFAVFSHHGNKTEELPANTDYYSLVLCLQGSCIRTVNQFQFRIVPGTLHLAPPHSVNTYIQASDDLQLYVILFKRDFLLDGVIRESMIENLLEPENDRPPVCLIKKERIELIRHLFHRLEEEYNSQQPFHGQMLRLLFIELLLETTRASDDHMKTKLAKHKSNRPQQLTSELKKLIEENYLDLRTVQQYADLLFVTPKHLSDVIKQETGLTPLHLIHDRIFQQAKYLLCASELTIKEIADQLSFDTSSHFSRFFKQYANYNPTDFRRIQCAIF